MKTGTVMLPNSPAGPAQHHLPHPGMAVDAHHDEVGTAVGGKRQEHSAHVGIRRHITLDRDLDAVPAEPSGRVGAQFCAMAFDRSRRIDGQNDNPLRRLEERQGVGRRACGLAAGIPAQQNDLSWRLCADIRHHENGLPRYRRMIGICAMRQ
jgi:hypothetical protein